MEKTTLINNVPDEFVCIAVQVQDAIYRWFIKELCELRQYEEGNGRSWRNGGDIVVELGVELQGGSKIVPQSRFCYAPTGRTLPFWRWNLRYYLKSWRGNSYE